MGTEAGNELIVIRKARPPCPFYGFNHVYGAFFDTKGNQCALIDDAYSPCQMENYDKPDWHDCHHRTEGNERKLIRIGHDRVFPNELSPEKGPWGGISFREWLNHVMIKQ